MDFWKTLGIEPTTDKVIIKQAYMENLNLFHPEEDPEGFQRLREAYESAIAQCETEYKIDNSPLGLWLQKVQEIYNSFSLRINKDNWEELLQDEVCFQIDSAKDASTELLRFLMDNYRIPQSVWKTLEQHFSWEEKKEELYNEFPKNFIDFLMNEIKYEDTIRYNLFEGAEYADYDEWFRLYYLLRDSLEEKDIEKQKEILEKVKMLEIQQPDMIVLETRHLLQIENIDKAKELAQTLVEKWPEDAVFLYNMGQVEFAAKETEKAEQYYKKVLELNPDNINANMGIGHCCLALEKFEDALECYSYVYNLYPYSGYVRECIENVKEGLQEKYKKQLKEDAQNSETLFKLAWIYYDLDKYELCKEIVEKIEPTQDNKPKYYDLIARLYCELDDFEISLDYLNQWLNICSDEKDRGYIYKQIGIQYQCLKEYEKALDYFGKSLEIVPNSWQIMNSKATIFNILERYEEAIEICSKAIELNDGIAHLYMNKAEALYNLNRYKEALDCCQICDNIYSYFTENYIIQIKIYFDVKEYEAVMDIIKTVEEYKLENSEVKLYKARTLNNMEKTEEAEKIFLELINDDSENDEVYYYFACFNNDIEKYEVALYYTNRSIKLKDETYKYYLRGLLYKKLKRYKNSLKDYFTIIKRRPEDNSAYNNRGLVYEELKDYKLAERDYKKAIALNPKHITANNNLGELYEKLNKYEEALECYNKQLQIEEDDYYYINRAWCYMKLHRYSEAEKDFNNVIETNPQNIYAYNGMGKMFMEQKEYEKAAEYFKKLLDVDNTDYSKYTYDNICECYEKLKENKLAEKYLSEAIEKYPNDESFYLSRGLFYSNHDEKAKALEDYEKAININPKYSYAYNNMGVVYRDMKQYEKAIEFYKKAIAIKPNNDKANENIGNVYLYNLKDYEKAVFYYTKHIELISDSAGVYRERAEAYIELGEIEMAKQDYTIALRYYLEELPDNEDYPCIYKNIGLCHEHLGEFDEAILYYKKSIELSLEYEHCRSSECDESYFRLGKISEAKGDMKEALKYYTKAKQIEPDEEEYQEAIDALKIS